MLLIAAHWREGTSGIFAGTEVVDVAKATEISGCFKSFT